MVGQKARFRTLLPIALFSILIILSYLVVKPFLIAIFLASLVAYIFNPLYQWLFKKTKKENVSAFLVCVFVLVLIIAPSAYFLKVLIQESYSIYNVSKDIIGQDFLQNCNTQLCESAKGILSNPQISFHIEKASQDITRYIIVKGSDALVAIPTLIINLMITLFALFYFLRDGAKLVDRVGYYLCVKKKEYVKIISRLKDITYGITYGYVLVAFLQGVLGALGFLVLGIPSPFFWGIVMGFLAMVPYLGTGLVWGPAAAYLIIDGMMQDSTGLIIKGIILIVYGTVIVSGMDNILRPKIIGDKAKVHPLLVLIGIFGGVYFFGPLGVIIGPMVLSLTAVIIETFLGEMPSHKDLKEFLKAS